MITEAPIRKCVGCGYCCIKTLCEDARRIYGNGVKECPELKWAKSRYVCGLMLKPGQIGHRYRESLYEGAGCCSGLNDWRNNVIPRRKQDKEKDREVEIDSLFQTFLHCLGREFIGNDTIYLTIFRMKNELEKQGKSEEYINAVTLKICHYLQCEKSSFMEDFIG